jgi:hypothetical protein
MLRYSYDRRATSMTAGTWYVQTFRDGEQTWFLALREQKNGGFAGKQVTWKGRTPKAISSSVPRSFAQLFKQIPEGEVPPEVLRAV